MAAQPLFGAHKASCDFHSSGAGPGGGPSAFYGDGSGSTLDHVTIAYAGAHPFSSFERSHCEPDGSNPLHENAAIIFGSQPASRFISNTTISDSAGYGVNELYYGMPIDFLATNTFTNVALCKQTTPALSFGMCPSTVSCPP